MCGRYVIFSTPEAIRALFRYGERPNFPPRYNMAPTQPVPIVRLVDGMRSFALMRWGLLPSWVEEPKAFLSVGSPNLSPGTNEIKVLVQFYLATYATHVARFFCVFSTATHGSPRLDAA